jgi:ATP-dependent protease HslVU (ClpYQ) peptidase subunit
MTVIAWDGATLAADKQSTAQNLKRTVTKIHRIRGELFATTGAGAHCCAMLEWFEGDRDPAKWPRQTDDDNYGNVIQVTRNGVFQWYGNGLPVPEPLEDKFMAFGCGRDFAIAAMHLGKSAREAVEIACVYDINCGNGVDVLTL